MAQATVFIYSLSCPITDCIRYIGKTGDPKNRLLRHLRDAKGDKVCHRGSWIRSLVMKGQCPVLKILDEVPNAEWASWEAAYIEFFLEQGCDLVNQTLGGDTGPNMRGYKHTPEAREKLRIANLGKPCLPETRLKIRASLTGRKLSPERCAKMSAAMSGEKHRMFGKKQPPEAVEKRRLAMLGRKSPPGTGAKISAALKGVPKSPAHNQAVSAAMKGKIKSFQHCAALSAAKKGVPWTAARWEAFRKKKAQSVWR